MPAVAPVTVTLKLQLPPAAIVAPVRLIVRVAATVVILFVPPHSDDVESAMVKPTGRTSVNATPVSATVAFGLSMAKPKLVELPVKIEVAPKILLITGGVTTVNESCPKPVEVVLGPVSVEVIFPLMLSYTPATSPKTLIEIVQLAVPESVPPLTSIVEVPAVAVIVSPVNVPTEQLWLRPFGVPINKPVGSVSENPAPVRSLLLGLAKVNVKVLLVASGMEDGENDLESVGTSGRGQPSILTLSSSTEAVAWLPRVTAVIRNQVLAAPEAAALAVSGPRQEPLETSNVPSKV